MRCELLTITQMLGLPGHLPTGSTLCQRGESIDAQSVAQQTIPLPGLRKSAAHPQPRTPRLPLARERFRRYRCPEVRMALPRVPKLDARNDPSGALGAAQTAVELARRARYFERLVPQPGLSSGLGHRFHDGRTKHVAR